jgi:hypothetical protein
MMSLMAKVGPIGVTFRGEVKLEDVIPFQAYTLAGQAKGGAAGFGRMKARIVLESLDSETTLLRYSAVADVGGKLASVGQRLILSVAKKQADDFFQQLTAILTGSSPLQAIPTAARTEKLTGVQHVAAPSEPRGLLGGLNALVPAWLVVFVAALGVGLGYCIALLP